MEPKPDITRATIITSAITLVVVLIAIAVLLLMSSGVGSISDMEYAVWETALRPGLESCPRVVDPETLVLIEGELDGLDAAEAVEGYLSADEVDPDLAVPLREALHDLHRKSEAPWPIENRFSPEMHARIMSSTDRLEIGGEDGWNWVEFYRKYGGGRRWGATHVSLSRVGFSRNGAYALAYWGTQSGGKSGMGGLLLLRWSGTKWGRVASLVTWVS